MFIKSAMLIISIVSAFLCISAYHTNNVNEKSPNTNNPVDYYSSIKPIISTYCLSCHSGFYPAGGFELNTYEEVRLQTEEGKLLDKINDTRDPMPKDGLMPLELRKAIENWAVQGYPEGKPSEVSNPQKDKEGFLPSKVRAVDIDSKGFEFFELMQGHWIGDLNILGQQIEWFAFDYRPISPSHIHGMYESGSIGNIITSFFIADFNGTKTIMARNGGLLNGIFRISYFVLDKVDKKKGQKYFRFVDAYGGERIMWMELSFSGDQLRFNSYTSRFGVMEKPKAHMIFKGQKRNKALAQKAAQKLNYPQNIIAKDFAQGLPRPDWGQEYQEITSATYFYQDPTKDLSVIGKLAGDPFDFDEIPYLSTLKVDFKQNKALKDQKIIIYLSHKPLTRPNGKIILEYGYVKEDLFNSVLAFPELAPNEETFSFFYLHPGAYYITLIADLNKDGYISEGDISSASQLIELAPKSSKEIFVGDF